MLSRRGEGRDSLGCCNTRFSPEWQEQPHPLPRLRACCENIRVKAETGPGQPLSPAERPEWLGPGLQVRDPLPTPLGLVEKLALRSFHDKCLLSQRAVELKVKSIIN